MVEFLSSFTQDYKKSSSGKMDFGWILNDELDSVKQEGKGSFQEEET